MTTNCSLYPDAESNGYFIKNVTDSTVLVTKFWRGNKNASHIDFFDTNAVAYWRSLMDQILDNDNYEVDGWKVDESDYYIRQKHDNVLTSVGIKSSKEYINAYYSEFYNYITRLDKRGARGMINSPSVL
ncbi:MAG TPA: TIM-barrel domain-containing protein [Ignavibacteriaceae bacterium]|nr:TIM-barrel domain-containing protein [Ignavibacteriaceae bacterium]